MKFKAVLSILISPRGYAPLGWSLFSVVAIALIGNVANAATQNDFARGSYFQWGTAQNGWAYCYEYTDRGDVLNNGNPVDNQNCERNAPSRAAWGLGKDGWGHCYRYAPTGVAMNKGQPIDEFECEAVAPSHYDWGRGQDGYTHCYKYEPSGMALNSGMSVDNAFCSSGLQPTPNFKPIPHRSNVARPHRPGPDISI